jgi:putative membrane protein
MEQLTIAESLSGLGSFIAYFGAGGALLAFFCLVYGWVTPYPEFKLIKAGKVAPAISFSGALLGFVIPLASVISHSVALLDMVIWALVALTIQIVVFLGLRLFIGDLAKEIADDRPAPAVLLAVLSLAAGILNAACMTY